MFSKYFSQGKDSKSLVATIQIPTPKSIKALSLLFFFVNGTLDNFGVFFCSIALSEHENQC